jgi:Ferritin-like
VMASIGAAPTFTRPNFPQRSDYFPPSVQLDLLPFGEAALTHFLYLERPEGMERADAAGFVPAAPPHGLVQPDEVMPRLQDFLTVGHLYRGIAEGLSDLAGRIGERALFVGPPRAQATPEMFRWPALVAVTDLGSAHQAIEEIIEQARAPAVTGSPLTTAGSSGSGRSTGNCDARIRPSSRPGRSSPGSPVSLSTLPPRSRWSPRRRPARSPSCSRSATRRCCRC